MQKGFKTIKIVKIDVTASFMYSWLSLNQYRLGEVVGRLIEKLIT
jgi:hypothetical protein